MLSLKLSSLIFLISLDLLFLGAAFAHGGGLNSSGCHNQRSNSTYHCHRSSYTPSAPVVRKPDTSSLTGNTLLQSFGSNTVSTKRLRNLEQKNRSLITTVGTLQQKNTTQSASIQSLMQRIQGLLLRVQELESSNKVIELEGQQDELLLKVARLEQKNKELILQIQQQGNIKNSQPSLAQQKKQPAKPNVPPSLKGVHRNKIRSQYGPPIQVRQRNGTTEWLYKTFGVRLSKKNQVIGMFQRGQRPAAKSNRVGVQQALSRPVLASSANNKYQLPENAKLDYTGSDWECIKGFYRVNRTCRKVKIPPNAKLDYTGSNWECIRGFRRHGNGCGRVQIPRGAKLDYTGSSWECIKGFRRHGNGCGRVQIPRHAKLDYTGSNWECIKGFRRHGNGCGRVQIPRNAKLDYTGSNWECNKGYTRQGKGCRAVGVLKNQ